MIGQLLHSSVLKGDNILLFIEDQRMGEPSWVNQKSVEAESQIQRRRFSDLASCNADMHKYCVLDDTGSSLMKTAVQHLLKVPPLPKQQQPRYPLEQQGSVYYFRAAACQHIFE